MPYVIRRNDGTMWGGYSRRRPGHKDVEPRWALPYVKHHHRMVASRVPIKYGLQADAQAVLDGLVARHGITGTVVRVTLDFRVFGE